MTLFVYQSLRPGISGPSSKAVLLMIYLWMGDTKIWLYYWIESTWEDVQWWSRSILLLFPDDHRTILIFVAVLQQDQITAF